MKSVLKKILKIPLYLVGFLIVLCMMIFLIIYLPFDYIRYKRSLCYKTTRKKYRPYVAMSNIFYIHNEILKNNLPISFLSSCENDDLACGYFTYGQTLIIPSSLSFTFDKDKGTWFYPTDEDEAPMTLEEFIAIELEVANKSVGDAVFVKAVVLIDEEELHEVMEAEKGSSFLVSYGDVAEALKKYISTEGV